MNRVLAGIVTDRVNVVGNESGQVGSFIAKGHQGDTVWTLDGVVITDEDGGSPADAGIVIDANDFKIFAGAEHNLQAGSSDRRFVPYLERQWPGNQILFQCPSRTGPEMRRQMALRPFHARDG